MMFKTYRVMPSVLSNQPPKLLFDVLDSMSENTNAGAAVKRNANYDSPYIRAVFG